MQYHYPWIPEGEPLELQGNVTGAKADLVKGVLKITVEVPLSPKNFAMRDRLATIVEMPLQVAVEIQALRMQLEKLADLRSQPAAPGQDRQYALGDVLLGEVLEEVAERVNAGELGPNVTATVSGGRGLDGLPLQPGPDALPTLLEAQIIEATAIVKQDPASATVSKLQRKMGIGYTRATQLLGELVAREIITPANGDAPAAD